MAAVKVHAFISGEVQGVGYRFYAKQEMRALGVEGWIKNLEDGRVEAVFEGPEAKVKEMIDWCWNGIPTAKVEDVEVTWERLGLG